MTNANRSPPPAAVPQGPGPWARLVRLFSSITLGVWLLSLLFLYSSIGSAGVVYPTSWNVFDGDAWQYAQLRQWRPFEMTEFEWFHWWPFDLLLALICVNVVTATLRRIPFRPLNYGVWGIHTGILTLIAGSVIYFGTKVEGDSPVARRSVVMQVGDQRVDFPAVPGARATLDAPGGPWNFLVQGVDPQWELQSGDDKGRHALSVTVAVEHADQAFMRQLLAGYPQYTEDIVRTDDPEQPVQRAIKALGRPLVDETLQASLDYDPQHWVYLANWVQKSWALYVRESGTQRWYQRPVEGLPLYNDYVASYDEVWLTDDQPPPLDPLDVRVPSFEEGDPLAGTDLVITSYLRYALMQSRSVPDETRFDPVASVLLRGPDGSSASYELSARAAQAEAEGLLRLTWVSSDEERTLLGERADPLLTLSVPGAPPREVPLTPDLRSLPEDAFTPLDGSPYAYRVNFWADGLVVEGQRTVSMASVWLERDGHRWERWVFENPELTHDRALPDAGHVHQDGEVAPDAHGGERLEPDTGIALSYRPGRRRAPFTLVAGPGESDLALLTPASSAPQPLRVGGVVDLGGGAELVVQSYYPRSTRASRPAIVPLASREREVKEERSMVRLSLAAGGVARSTWVPFHLYPVRDAASTLRRYEFDPAEVVAPDGRPIEVVLSRQRLALPGPVALDDFLLTTHVGGFSGRTSSIRNWTSLVRFGEDGGWSDPVAVSLNEPIEHDGYWYFQAQWDPPSGPRFAGDPPSAGLNYTVLGVGNRNGVGVQLGGCCIAVAGMLYAFYVKPLLRRRHAAAAGHSVADRALAAARPQPVGMVEGDQA